MDNMLRNAAEGFERRLDGVRADGWTDATPCADWDVRALVNHVVGELLWVAPLLDGKTIAEVGDQFDGDVLGDDPKAAYRSAMAVATAAAARSGGAEVTVHLSYGDFPGAEYLAQIGTDVTIHTWDLARGASQDDKLDAELVEAAYEYLAPQVDAWRSAGAFGPAVEVPADADVQTRLLAIAGRDASS
jgi:uncharacterized protein (TIGR03086 family)